MTNFYEVLNCDVDASSEEIRKNYKELILKYHPDKQNVEGSHQFCLIQKAWNILSDPRRRQLFDEELKIRNSNPILYGSFNIDEFLHDAASRKYFYVCRCGGNYYLEEEELKLTRTFRILHLPCENCSLTVQLVFENNHRNGSFDKIQNCNCERKCFDRVPTDAQQKIFKGYNSLPSHNEKNLYLYGLMCKISDKGDQPNSRASYRYFVKVNGFQVDICQKAFINIHGITPAKVRTLLHKLNEGVFYPNDRRGEARKFEITEAVEQDVIDHITSIVQIQEVWDRIKSGEKINVVRLWEDYKTFYHSFPSSIDENSKNEASENNRLVGKNTYTVIFKSVYPEIVKKLDKKNELSINSRKRKRKAEPEKRTVEIFVTENSEESENYENESDAPTG